MANRVPDYKAEYLHLREKFDELQKHDRATVGERDKLRERIDQLEATLKLYAGVEKYMPCIGLVCDGDCGAAIGVVGVKMIDVDDMNEPMVAVAKRAGWVVVDVDETGHGDVRPHHYCPRCKERNT